MKKKIILTIFLTSLFLLVVASFSISSGTTGMAIVQSANSVEFPGIALILVIIVAIGGFVFIRSQHQK